jgi:hypothetical protein
MTGRFINARSCSFISLCFLLIVLSSVGAATVAPQPADAKLRMVRFEGDPVAKGLKNFLAASPSDSAKQAATNAFFILQFKGPVRQEWLDRLKKAGVEFHDHIPEYAYLVKIAASALSSVQADSDVRWLGSYDSGYKIGPMSLIPPPEALRTQKALRENLPDQTKFSVLLFKGEDIGAVGTAVENLGGKVLGTQSYWHKDQLDIQIDPAKLSVLARIPVVKWIEQSLPISPCSNIVASNTVCDVKTVWDTYGLHGEGQVVGIADSGLDTGNTNTLNLDFKDGQGNSRILLITNMVGTTNLSDFGEGHGTMVAGCLLGNGYNSGANPTNDDFPSSCFAGMAPKAQGVFQVLTEITPAKTNFTILDITGLFSSATNVNTNLFIHSDSWGSWAWSRYDSRSYDVDAFMWSNKNFLAVFGAGNEGIDSDSSGRMDAGYNGAFPGQLRSPGTAKNCITVGATESLREDGWGGSTNCTWGEYTLDNNGLCFPADPVHSDHVSDNVDGIMARSSRGPCEDGRFKPDIVAPGMNVLTVRGTNTTGCYGLYTGDADHYAWFGGTSCSTPLVAGMAALVRQYLTEGRYPGVANPPSAALIKAILLNGAKDIAPGQYGTDGGTQEIPYLRPNNVAGWGRADLNSTLYSLQGSGLKIFGTDICSSDAIGTNDVVEYQVTVKAGTPLTATLVWTDYPGSPVSGGALVNDLDLTVIAPDGTTNFANNPKTPDMMEHLWNYEDDSSESTEWERSVDGKTIAVKFTPGTNYPTALTGAKVKIWCNEYSETFAIELRSETGSGPGSVLTNTTVLPFQKYASYQCFPFSYTSILPGSNYYICAAFSNDHFYCRANTNGSGNSWISTNGGSTWASTNCEFLVDAFFSHDVGQVSQDRVNNVEGIDIANPSSGAYTIRVTGNAIPQGDPDFDNKQPFAVVVRGDFPDLRRQAMGVF